ncbi:MAG: EcsC family protein [Lachnospiraceae bacterium]|nr:EcsC family protein [Lachnospiraceae bacterium]
MNQKQIKNEFNELVKDEEKFITRNIAVKENKWQEKISKYVPETLDKTLNTAFCKAFGLIFEKGTGFIEKTYNKEKREQDFKVNEYSADLRNNKSSIKKFGRLAFGSKVLNMAISTAEGVGMGVFGMGIPDIPVFLSVILKSIYETALHFGFGYETEEEQMFILKIIETALCHEDELVSGDMEINDWIKSEGKIPFLTDKKAQIEKTSDLLSKELLYLKFIQGIPVAGIVGGISDVIYQKKITDYAVLKYKRRFLSKHMEEDVVI